MIWLLFRYRLKMLLSVFRGGRVGRSIAVAVAFAAAAFAVASLSFGLYEFARMSPENGPSLLESLVALSFHGMFVFLCFMGLSLAVFTIFFSNDLDLLFSLPIKSSQIFFYKVAEATFLNTRVSILLLIPSLVIVGLFYKASVFYYVIALIVTLCMASVPGAVGIIIGSYLSRKIPRVKLKGSLTVIGGLIGVAIWAVMNQFTGHMTSQTVGFSASSMRIVSLASSPIFKWLPSGWAFGASINAARGNWAASLGPLLLLCALSLILLYISFALMARQYSGGISEEVAEPAVATARLNLAIGGSPLMAHVRRDLMLLSRESAVIMQCLIILIFVLLFPFVGNQKEFPRAFLMSLSPPVALLAAFFGGQVGTRLVPLERMAFWQNLIIPDGQRLAVVGKAISGLSIITLLTAAIGVVHLVTGKINGVGSIVLLASFSWAGFGVGFCLSAFFSNFKWDNPRNLLKGGGNFIYLILTIFSAGIMYGVGFLISRLLSGMINPIVIMVMLSLGLLVIAVVIAAVRVVNMEWNPDV
jgi:ABC-2 type transport system permease protein